MVKNLSEIRREIKAVEETRQITNAMYLLSTSRMKKAMQMIEYNQMYMRRIRATVKDILAKSYDIHHTYLEKQGERAAFVIIAADKSMCGAYNFNVTECAINEIGKYDNPYIGTIGICGTEILKSKGYKIEHEWFGASQKPSIFHSRQISEYLINMYDAGEIDEIYVVYTRYVNSAFQKAECVKLLPLSLDNFEDVNLEYEYEADIIYEPSPADVFNTMAPQYMLGMMYGFLNHSSASEHASRMNSMQSATHNADEMIQHLDFEYNTARQSAITAEITEIAAAVEIFSKD